MLGFCPVCGETLNEQYVEAEEHDRLICSQGHILYINPKIVAGAIPRVGNDVWLLRRGIEPRYGAWTFPAGFMEMGETVEQAAARETREELGMPVRIDSLLGVYSRPESNTVHIVYLATALGEPTGGRETIEFAKFSPDAVPWHDLAFWSTHQAMRDWLAAEGLLSESDQKSRS